MENVDFVQQRKKLNKTQQQMADILGISVKSIRSYEQGWRNIPPSVERQVYFLLSNRRNNGNGEQTPCWELKSCKMKEKCPVWEFQCGHLCWFLCGTPCDCTKGLSSSQKLVKCKSCDILVGLIK